LAIIEGVRVVTGGKVDLIGTITGINRPRYDQVRYADNPGRHRGERVWVPHYVWKEVYVPMHTEYRPGCGEVVVEAHYERYEVEEGGHWEVRCDSGYSNNRSKPYYQRHGYR